MSADENKYLLRLDFWFQLRPQKYKFAWKSAIYLQIKNIIFTRIYDAWIYVLGEYHSFIIRKQMKYNYLFFIANFNRDAITYARLQASNNLSRVIYISRLNVDNGSDWAVEIFH